MMQLDILKEIGLTNAEIQVYLSLLELGQSTTGPIVEKAKTSSSKIYHLLKKLINKGLVSYVLKGSIKYFEATPPERILDLLKEKEKEIEQQRKNIEKILPELTRKKALSKLKENAAIYKGIRGLETTFYEALELMKEGETYHVIGIPSRSDATNRFFVKWDEYRASKKVKAKLLFNEQARGELQTQPKNNPLSEMRYLPEGIITPAAINIFKNRTIIFPSETSEEPLLIVIDSKEIADSFRTQFDLLWNQTTLTFTGVEGPKYVLNDIMNTKYDENLAFGLSGEKLNKYVPKELAQLVKLQDSKKINPARLIFTGKIIKSELSKVSKFRILPEKFSTPFHYEVYANKVAIIYWTTPIITTVIENKEVADNYRKHFNEMWKIAKA